MAKLAPVLGVLVALTAAAACENAAAAPRDDMALATSSPALVLYQQLYQASVRASRATGRLLEFIVPDSDSSTAAPFAAGATAAAGAMVSVAGGPGGRQMLARIDTVNVQRGPYPAARVIGRRLMIYVDPSIGDAGRPSQADIERAITWPRPFRLVDPEFQVASKR